MNYRHAYHAGGFADCVKHAVLVWLLRALQRKPTPLGVLDTHAGAGRYDLAGAAAERTGEWREGIGRLLDDPPPELTDYVGLVRECGLYPGSPALIRAMLRPQDRLVCCELHSEEHAALRRLFALDPLVSVHHRDAWEAVQALLPPKQRRGLVLIDPPYEDRQDFEHLARALQAAHRRFATGVFAAWYPIKHRSPVREFFAAMQASQIRDIVAAELVLREPVDPTRLNGCGMLVINPPYRFEAAVAPMLASLLARVGHREPGEAISVQRLSDE